MPRNKPAFLRGQIHRELLRRAWVELLGQNPFATPTAKELRVYAASPLSERSIRWHLAALRAEAAERCRHGNSSGDPMAASSTSTAPESRGFMPLEET